MTKEEAIKYLQQLYPNGGHCWLDEQRIEAIGMAIDALSHSEVTKISDQQEPVSNDFETALAEMVAKAQTNVVEPWVVAAQWKDELIKLAKSEEPVSKDLGEYINELSKQFPEVSFAKLSRIAVRVAQWQKQQMVTEAIDATCFGIRGAALFTFRLPAGIYRVGSKVKVIIIKED